ncbi:MAG: glucose-1-phosphate adenylyltransferase [Planctomycetia bacterium]|nr:glucose-1-phosphate adenylyltransferase [Planctomycetia bacterium]
MDKVLALILGGGRGTRLYPLTKVRSKPAVPVAGKYRLIDIPLSNCINSGILKVYVLTQFNSMSLHRHIRSAYMFDIYRRGFIEILAAEQTIENPNWYQGTADAVKKSMRYIESNNVDYVIILSGDQLYRMDFREMLKVHQECGADATIASIPVAPKDTHGLGIMRIDETGQVRGFLEKPQSEEELEGFETDLDWIAEHGIDPRGRSCLASMGIYIFNKKLLVHALSSTEYKDFGKEVFPALIRSKKVHTYVFDGYWEDIGTIRSFFDANLSLAKQNPPFEMFQPDAPIYTNARFLPSTQVSGATISDSLIADGCTIGKGAVIENSVIGVRCQIGENVTIRNSIVMGCDFYEHEAEAESDEPKSSIPLGIGQGSYIENAIIDKNCRIGDSVRIMNAPHWETMDETEFCQIVDGIVVVQKGNVIPSGWVM